MSSNNKNDRHNYGGEARSARHQTDCKPETVGPRGWPSPVSISQTISTVGTRGCARCTDWQAKKLVLTCFNRSWSAAAARGRASSATQSSTPTTKRPASLSRSAEQPASLSNSGLHVTAVLRTKNNYVPEPHAGACHQLIRIFIYIAARPVADSSSH